MNRRGFVSGIGLGALTTPGLAAGETTGVIIQTFLKAAENRRAELGQFITLNWLPVDRAGIEAGIFTYARLFETVDDPDCDFVMEVGYIDPGGYAGSVVETFTAVRSAHEIVLVNGLGLSELGVILGERSYRPVASA